MTTAQGGVMLVGADRPFGPEIAARLDRDGYTAATAGQIALLVVNTPVALTATRFADITDGDFARAMQTLLLDVVDAAQSALPRMVRGGRIVHVAARGHLGAWGGAHLMAANAALIGMTRSMALELAASGIRVNALAPDFVGERWDTPEAREQVAAAVSFLGDPHATMLTGETLLLDGGRSLRMSESRRPATLER